MLAAVALFVIPVEPRKGVFAMDGEWAAKLPWGVVVLFGGGLALAAGIRASGLAAWIGASATSVAALPTLVVMLAIVTAVIFLTEVTSNTATTSTLLPIVAGVAVGIGENRRTLWLSHPSVHSPVRVEATIPSQALLNLYRLV